MSYETLVFITFSSEMILCSLNKIFWFSVQKILLHDIFNTLKFLKNMSMVGIKPKTLHSTNATYTIELQHLCENYKGSILYKLKL
jgi:hypothetical protein